MTTGSVTVEVQTALTRPARAILLDLRDATSTAHEQMMAARRPPHDRATFEAARLNYLGSLMAYADALRQLGLPLPRRLRDDLRLLQRLVGNGRSR